MRVGLACLLTNRTDIERLKMCSKDDFCDWSDINLDELLEEYTDDDVHEESTSGSDSYVYHGEMSKLDSCSRPSKQAKNVEYLFDCPQCQKVLKSVSGFRGHVIKQHPSVDRSDFRVADYRRCDVTGACASGISSPASEATGTTEIRKPTAVLNESDFCNLFIANTLKAWHAVSEDPLLSLPQSKQGAVMTHIAKSMIDKSETIMNFSVIKDKLKSVFVNRPLVTQSDRDLLMSSIHTLRVSSDIQMTFTEYIATHLPDIERDSCMIMFQIWLRKFLKEMMNSMVHMCNPADDKQIFPKALSDTDQNVLYHICGYLIMKLKSASFRSKKLKSAEMIINCIAAKVPKHSGHFVEEYTKWVSKQNRGGLLYPNADFYLLIREFDAIYRQVIATQNLTSESLKKSNLQLAVHDSFMVKHYWGRILQVACCDEHSSLPALDYLINLFLTIKGFAVARKERDSLLMKDGKMKGKLHKKKESLRGKLKGAK